MSETRKLYRSTYDRKIAGVCGGIAEYFDINPTLVRLFFVLLVLGSRAGLLVYIVLAVFLPEEPGEKVKRKNDQDVITV